MTDTCTTCGRPADPHPYRHPITRAGRPRLECGCLGDCHGGHTIQIDSPAERLVLIDRALWVDHGNGNLDALTGELPIWADNWAARIVSAVNDRPRFSDRHLAEVTAERDALRDKAVDYSRYVTDLEAERDELRARPAQARIDAEDAAAKVRVLAERVAELEAAQREPIGYIVVTTNIRGDRHIPTKILTRQEAEEAADYWRGMLPGIPDARVVELLEPDQRGRPA